MSDTLNIAVEGCCHGQLDDIYQAVAQNELRAKRKVDLLVVCGDFECIRDIIDLECLAVPQKYRKLNSFHQYVTGDKVAPVTTIFVGGNHEASNVLQSLYYGGYVAPNIYFMGFAGVVNFRGVRIAGLSGIFNQKHYRSGHFERPPYTEDTLRSVYHMRELEVYRMAHLANSSSPIDIFISHDWPSQIWEYGNKERLLKIKPYFREDMISGKLGNPPLMHLLQSIQPSYWFAAHLHVKFSATVPHFTVQNNTNPTPLPPPPPPGRPPAEALAAAGITQTTSTKPSAEDSNEIDLEQVNSSVNASDSTLGKRLVENRRTYSEDNSSNYNTPTQRKVTHFLALDKVLPGRDFLQFMQIPVQASNREKSLIEANELQFDPEWVAILQRTHNLLQTHPGHAKLPETMECVTEQEIASAHACLIQQYGSLVIPPIGPMHPTVIAGECIPAPSSSHGYPSASTMNFTQECLTQQQQTMHGIYGPASQHISGQQYSSRGGRAGRGGRGRGRSGAAHSQQQHSMLFNPTSRVTPLGNHQTDRFLQALGREHIWTVPCEEVVNPFPLEKVEEDSENMMASFVFDFHTARAKLPILTPDHSNVSVVTHAQYPPPPAAPGYPKILTDQEDTYGLRAYYGDSATSTVATIVKTAGIHPVCDPSELDIDFEEAKDRDITESGRKQEIEVSEVSVNNKDPNHIDLDF